MAALVKVRLENRAQNLVHRLLDQTIHDIRNPQTPLTATGFGNPNTTDISGNITRTKQRLAKMR